MFILRQVIAFPREPGTGTGSRRINGTVKPRKRYEIPRKDAGLTWSRSPHLPGSIAETGYPVPWRIGWVGDDPAGMPRKSAPRSLCTAGRAFMEMRRFRCLNSSIGMSFMRDPLPDGKRGYPTGERDLWVIDSHDSHEKPLRKDCLHCPSRRHELDQSCRGYPHCRIPGCTRFPGFQRSPRWRRESRPKRET